MYRIRAQLTKIYDDGTEVVVLDMEDSPWYVTPALKKWAHVLHIPAPPHVLEGQEVLGWN